MRSNCALEVFSEGKAVQVFAGLFDGRASIPVSLLQ